MGVEDPVETDQIQMDGARTSSSGLAPTTDINNTSLPTARNCVDYVVSYRLCIIVLDSYSNTELLPM